MSEVRFIAVSLFVIVTLVLMILYSSETIADLWVRIDANSLVGFGALIEKNIHPDLWALVFVPALKCPLWVVTLVVSVLLLLLGRRRGPRHSRYSS